MRNAIATLRNEHHSLAAVLYGLRMVTREAQNPAVRPDFAVFYAMLRYIYDFPERLHHPKEDEFLFPRLAARSEKARGLIDELRADHLRGAQLTRDLEKSLLGLEAQWPGGGARFSALVDEYANFHRDHMRKEEDLLLPLAERSLTEEDWSAIEEAFAGNEDPIADLREKDFRELFSRIVNLAPAPIGLGERWGRRA